VEDNEEKKGIDWNDKLFGGLIILTSIKKIDWNLFSRVLDSLNSYFTIIKIETISLCPKTSRLISLMS